MLLLLWSLVLLQCASSPTHASASNDDILPYTTKYMYTEVDHFNYVSGTGDKLFRLRYLVSDKFYNGKGPVLFYCGNEGDITNFWNNTGFMFTLAKDLSALVVFGEHRYYGQSLPFGKTSFDPKYIGFLTIEQALADYAILIRRIHHEYKTEGKPVIAMGGSYGGILAGYMRYKFPHIITAAVASSAPFLTIAGRRPRSEFWASTTNTFKMADRRCPKSVNQGFAKLIEMLEDKTLTATKVKSIFNLCEGQLKKNNFKENMLAWLRNAFTLLAMLDYPYPTNFMAALPGHPVNKACSYMTGEDKVKGLADIANLLYGTKHKCHDTFAEYVACSDPTGCGTGPDNPPWDYQTCTEMFLGGGSTNMTDMFPHLPFTLLQRHEYCKKRFGIKRYGVGFNHETWLGVNYFATLKDIQKASRIIFPNGDLDPWNTGGVLKDLSPSLIAIVIKGGAHHLDLRAPNKADPTSVRVARRRIREILVTWMAEDGFEI